MFKRASGMALARPDIKRVSYPPFMQRWKNILIVQPIKNHLAVGCILVGGSFGMTRAILGTRPTGSS